MGAGLFFLQVKFKIFLCSKSEKSYLCCLPTLLSANDLSDENLSFRQYIEQCARHATSSGDDMATESRLYSVPCEVAPDSIVSVSGAGDR